MSRMKLSSVLQPVEDDAGNAITGASVEVDGTIYAAETGGTTLTNPQLTVNGRAEGWIDYADTDITITWRGQEQIEAVRVGDDPATVSALAANPINVQLLGAVPDSTVSADKTANATAFAAAINQANTAHVSIYVPPGEYHFPDDTVLPTVGDSAGSGCVGLTGAPTETVLVFRNATAPCLIVQGLFKKLAGLFVDNQVASTKATIKLRNVAYSRFEQLYARADGASSTAIQLVQEYTAGSAYDAFLLVHLGCWYNKFDGVTANYGVNGSAGGNVGDGLTFQVAASATSVVNPTGEPAGTYSGSVAYNRVDGLNIEGKARGLLLDAAPVNTFIGGHFIGCTNQVVGINVASKNIFIGLRHSQWATNAYNIDNTCTSNIYIGPVLYLTTPTPWSLGNLGGNPQVLASPEFGDHGLLLSDVKLVRAAANRVTVGAAAEIGEIQTSYAGLKYAGLATNNAAIQQSSAGATFIGAASGQEVALRVNAVSKVRCAGVGVAFNDTAPIAKPALPAAATDTATTQALANAIRSALINYGLTT